MTLDINVMAWYGHTNMAQLDWLIESIPLHIDSRIPNSHTDINN